jgi:hypothetical protein
VSLNSKPNGVLRPGRSGFRPAGDGLHPRRCRDQSPLGYNVAHSLLESTGSGAMIHPPVPKIENPGQQEYLSSPNPAVTNLILGNVEVCLAFNGREHLPSPSCRRLPIGDLSGLAPRKGGASSVSPTAADETILRGVGLVRRGASFVRWRFGGCSTDCRSRKSRASWIDLSPRGFSDLNSNEMFSGKSCTFRDGLCQGAQLGGLLHEEVHHRVPFGPVVVLAQNQRSNRQLLAHRPVGS